MVDSQIQQNKSVASSKKLPSSTSTHTPFQHSALVSSEPALLSLVLCSLRRSIFPLPFLLDFQLMTHQTLDKKPKGDGTTPAPAPMTTMELLKAPGVGIVLALYGHVMLLGLAYTAGMPLSALPSPLFPMTQIPLTFFPPVCPVFWFTSPEKGGYGFTPIQISMFLGGIGISQGLWLLVAFPILHKRFGTGNILRVCYILWPIFFVAAPMCNLFLRWGGPWRTVFWIVGPTLQIGGSGVSMAFSESCFSQ